MKLYREDQRYHDIGIMTLITVLAALLIVTVIAQSGDLGRIILGVVLLGGIFYLVSQLRLKIRISPKKMSVRVDPLPFSGVKVNRNDVKSIKFIQSDPAELTSGWAVRYGGKLRIFDFGDREGMVIRRNDGRDIVVLSKKLFDQRKEIKQQLESSGWNLNKEKTPGTDPANGSLQ